MQTRDLFLSYSVGGGGDLSNYIKGVLAVLEGMGQGVYSSGCIKQSLFCP